MTELWALLKSLLFGLIEGITEWLPISSTGHLILFDQFVPLGMGDAFGEMFTVVIQLGAILAVVVLYWKRLFPFRLKPQPAVQMPILKMWVKILVACVPAAIVGILFDDVFNQWFYNPWSIALALIVFGVLFIVIENHNQSLRPRVTSIDQLTYRDVILIGIFQLLAAIFPGTSRSGATIIGALMIGVSRKVATEFTFFLAVPVMFGASLLKILKFGFAFTGLELAVLFVGMLSAFLVSVVVIRFLMSYIKKHDFKPFGWYRIALGLLVLFYFGVIAK